jgi:hypothetical protein
MSSELSGGGTCAFAGNQTASSTTTKAETTNERIANFIIIFLSANFLCGLVAY